MSSQTVEAKANEFAEVMKRDWNQRASENSRWYINTVRLDQSEDEFDATGLSEINTLILPELILMTGGRGLHELGELKFLEIGCGIGRMTKHLAAIFGEVHSTDVSGEMIRQARGRLGHLPNVHLHETSGADFAALPDGYFDVAFSAYVFQHVPSKAVIESNIREAYRVIKPGGIIRVHTNGVEAQSYAEAEKDTWSGATFTESEIRRLVKELGAQLISVYGADTMFCWTTIQKPRKPFSSTKPHEEDTKNNCRIEFHARADDSAIQAIPTGGDDAWLSLVVSGLDREVVDANNLKVSLGNQFITPRYVGRPRPHFDEALQSLFGSAFERLTYIEARIPAGTSSGKVAVSVVLESVEASPGYEVELIEAKPAAPKIVTVRNGFDYQAEIHASGPKSLLRLFVEGLNDAANCQNVNVKVGELMISPTFVGFVTDIASYQVDAQLPVGVAIGETSLELIFNGIASEAVAIEIKP
ncbi:MAG: methyltransferase domain-containing protein [Acidobacteriota bacterium]|nr:methyltransferase domain-containing protein [Acidobacteriota bacterium]